MPYNFASIPLLSPVQLLVYEENTGAYELAIEIQAQCPGKITLQAVQGVESFHCRGVENDIPKPILDISSIMGNEDIEKGS